MTHSRAKYVPLTPTELDAFNRLSNHHKRTFANSMEASKRFVFYIKPFILFANFVWYQNLNWINHKIQIKSNQYILLRFKEEAKSSSEVPSLLVQMAKKYELHGGHWILFFNKMEPPRRYFFLSKFPSNYLIHFPGRRHSPKHLKVLFPKFSFIQLFCSCHWTLGASN